MGFLGVYKAIYDYVPQGESELAISEGDILYVLEKSGEDDWWRAKKRATAEDDDEPVGLIPNNYIEEATPISHARALFDYTRQTDEELSFSEDTQLEVFDTSDPDWILVGHDNEYGFVPANYIDLEGGDKDAPPTPARPTASTSRQSSGSVDHSSRPESPSESAPNPAAAIASIMGGRAPKQVAPPPMLNFPPRPQQFTPEASDEEEAPTPSLPVRPQSQTVNSSSIYDRELPRSPPSGVIASPPHNRATFRGDDDDGPTARAPQGFHLYNINEMVSVMGKKKKMPTTLGINLATGTIMIAPEKARDGASQEWTAEKLTYYSIEGKHVFLELVRPSKSVDFHAGAKDTAHEIDGALRDLAGAVKAEGLKEVLMAASGGSQKTGKALHEFMAQGDDEVSVAVDDEVIILDDTKSDDWWHIRRVKNGKEGVVPSSYLEITGILAAKSTSRSGINAGRSIVEQNRLEEQRLTREASRSGHGDAENEVGPGMRLPERNSSLSMQIGNQGGQQRGRDPNPSQSKSTKSKPDPKKVRTWTDRSKSFSVEAQFLVLKDGKINLHKTNGVKIAVPVVKMSVEDLEYVEEITGVSLDEDKPLSDIKRQRTRAAPSNSNNSSSAPAGASVERKQEYDWFPFFLSCDVQVGLCERYAQIFSKGSMDESVMPDIDATVLRNLGIKEGDIIKIMRVLDAKYNRNRKRDGSEGDAEGGGLFSGPGGSLRNNTRKGRPAPAVQTSDIVDPKAFSQGDGTPSREFPEVKPQPRAASPPAPNGFDDNAWDKPKPAAAQSQPQVSRPAPTAAAAPPQNAFTQSMKELSLLDMPALEPTKVQPPPSQPIQLQSQPQQSQPAQQQQAPQQTGATPAFFSGVNQQPTGQQQQYQQGAQFNQPQSQQNIARQRPVAPQYTQNTSSLMIPPPPRPLSAPQTAQQSSFGPPPLQPQMTGVPSYQSPQLAPPGQSLAEMNQMRMQQQYQQQQIQQPPNGFGGQQGNVMMQQPTGFQGYGVTQQQNGFGQPVQPQQTGFIPQSQFGMGNQAAGPFADPRGQQFSPIQAQPTGFQSSFPQTGQQFPQQTGVGGVNQFLPPALIPQPTAMQQQPTGMNGFGQNSFGQPPPIPPMPQQNTMTPLQPQKTGPPPPIRFGVTGDTKKLMPQATGRRANLSQATPQNPFGF